ncbi:TfuA domain-containing protein [Streptomyces sp. LP05-1]|uniref:TfuA domain-containing protein n=1 Tax=Streptomyces pyxinae TaxID=2970734 RepID=A0ABT2CC80_9ACTN|nr:TfuA domain-containing protein [Streptomyces sp. LP05-1]MCS0634994.1 TfuA domain-containing protein [Streptomyces sp. LP05-1]
MIGAASIGALRAVELAPFGMLGVGRVHAAYARGEITGDDEVAVGQAPDGDYEALTWPLVNLRHVLELAREAGVLDGEWMGGLLTALRAVYYPQRTWSAVRAVCRRHGQDGFVRWLDGQRERDRYFGDVKRADALEAVRVAATGGGTGAPGFAGQVPVWRTPYFLRWSNAALRTVVRGLTLSTEDRVLYQQLFDPEFPGRWADFLAHCSLHPTDGGPGVPLGRRLAEAGATGMAAHQVFHPRLDLRDEETVARLLAGESGQDRAAVARYADAHAWARRSRPGFTVGAVREDLACHLLLHQWRVSPERLDVTASARGLVSGARAVDALRRFVPGLLEDVAAGTAGRRVEVSCAGG